MSKDKKKRTGAYQHGEYLGGPDTPPAEEEKFVAGRDTGAYQNGRQIGGTESSDTQSADTPRTRASHRKPGGGFFAKVFGSKKKD